MEPYVGIRLGLAEMVRGTEQTAIIMSHFSGFMGRQVQKHRSWANDAMKGFLRRSCCPVRLFPANDHSDFNDRLWKNGRWSGAFKDGEKLKDKWELEVSSSAVDGATALREGRSGSLSVIAAAKPGTFLQVEPNDLLVIVLGRKTIDHCNAGRRKNRPRFEEVLQRKLCDRIKELNTPSDLDHFLQMANTVDEIVKSVSGPTRIPSIGLTFEAEFARRFVPKTERPYRKRRLDGSTVAAALAALLNKVDASIMITRREQALQIATATRGMGGCLLALPLVDGTIEVNHEGQILREADFLEGDQAFLVATSITEVCIMDRVRFADGLKVSTDSIAVSVTTRSVRRIHHELDLNRAWFRDLKATKPALEVIDRYLSKMA